MLAKLLLSTVISIAVAIAQEATISADSATHLAEEFIVANGYTDTPATNDSTNIAAESLSFLTSRLSLGEILRMRANTLQKAASFAFPADDSSKVSDWLVLFPFFCDTNDTSCIAAHKNKYRVVKVSANGHRLMMMHTSMMHYSH
jgi:hypothetical protein